MTKHVLRHASNVNPATLILTGATEIRKVFPLDQQPAVIAGYMAGLKVVFGMTIAAAGIATLIGTLTRWERLNAEQRKGGGAA